MAPDSKATPEEQFNDWLAEQEAGLVPLPHHLPARRRLAADVVPFLVCLFFWVVTLWSFGSGVRALLRALRM